MAEENKGFKYKNIYNKFCNLIINTNKNKFY
jgi:hypothetical protein